jgi:predicted phosphodiesterase
MADEKNILVLSDIHVGSSWGLWPDQFDYEDTKTGNVDRYLPNTTQRKLLVWWNEMLGYISKKDIQCIILNGDLVEGYQRKEYGRGTMPDLSVQMEACINLLEQLPDVPMYFTRGSGYHVVAGNMSTEQWIARAMGGIYGDDLLVEECGIRMHVQHHVPVSNASWQYRSTPLARDLLLHALNASADKYGRVDVALRAHAHYFVAVYFRSQLGIISPCWQTRTPYAVKKDIVTPPDIGYLLLKVEDQNNVMIDRHGINHIERPCKTVNRGNWSNITRPRRRPQR